MPASGRHRPSPTRMGDRGELPIAAEGVNGWRALSIKPTGFICRFPGIVHVRPFILTYGTFN